MRESQCIKELGWLRIRMEEIDTIANDELEKFRLNISRSQTETQRCLVFRYGIH